MLGFIVEIIGEEAAAKLIARFGGTRLYVPHTPCPDDALALAVGTGAAMKLAQMFGGERVELPKPPPRRMQILALRAAGRSVEEIRAHLTARAGACSRCWPRRAARSAPAPARSDDARARRVPPGSARVARGPDHGLSHASSLLSPRPHCLRERA